MMMHDGPKGKTWRHTFRTGSYEQFDSFLIGVGSGHSGDIYLSVAFGGLIFVGNDLEEFQFMDLDLAGTNV